MEMKEAAQIAVREHNAILAAKITDHIRLKLDLTWEQTFQLINAWTGVDRAQWDGLLYEADQGYG